MRLADFQRLSNNEKADCLWEKGKPVGTYEKETARFVLYQLDGFYVEAEYKTDFKEIVALRPCDINDLPPVYLVMINLSGLDI